MTPRPVTLSTEVQLSLIVPGATTLPVRARLNYNAHDPYALTVAFHTGGASASDTVEWTFARELLMDGVTAPAGQGDVRVWPTMTVGEGIVCLSLCSPSGKALFEVPVADLLEFLAMTYTAVPTGTESEYVDVDGGLALLLATEPGA